MATLFPTTVAPNGFVSTDPELAAIDASVRWPVLVCFLSAVHWMVVGTFLLVYASALTHPQDSIPILGLFNDLSNNFSMFTYGRVWPAALDALVYGWASTAGLGLAAWVLARTCRQPICAPAALMTAVIFWNLGVAIGLTGIFMGDSSSVELLEFPAYASWILWFAYAVFGLWTIATFLGRRPGNDQIAQSWILMALFAFPWLYGAGSTLLSSRNADFSDGVGHAIHLTSVLPGSGVVQGVIQAWYVHGIYTLWLAPLGLGLLYYLIPKVSGISIRYGAHAYTAFWTWIIFAPWTAVHDLIGGPFPAQTVTVGLWFAGLLFIPVALIGMNLISTAFTAEGQQGHHGGVVFPFLVLASVSFVLAGASEQILSVRAAADLLRFTMFRECNTFLWIYGFFSFVVFGSIYYIVPRLLDFGWRSAMLVRIHYYTSLYGILLVIAMLGFGGVMQGNVLENPQVQVTIVTANDVSESYHIAATMCISLIAIGNGVFAFHLAWMLIDWLRLRVRGNRLAAEILMEPYEEVAPLPAAASEEVRA
jgi:cytochrome c oxidase cbb3-type subunit 1